MSLSIFYLYYVNLPLCHVSEHGFAYTVARASHGVKIL